MASKAAQLTAKRAVKPKTQYSPSDVSTNAKYYLIIYNDTEEIVIVGNSSVKRLENDGSMVLNNGRTARVIVTGTKDKCIDQWNKRARSSKDVAGNNNDEQLQCDDNDDDDDMSDFIQQTLQAPATTFSTPAPYRRQKTVVRRSNSPDSVFSVSSPKRFAHKNSLSRSTKRQNNDLSSSRNSNRVVQVVSPVAFSSEDEEVVNIDNPVSLNRLFEELQNTQANILDTRTENHGIHQELMKLTKKMSHFSSLLSPKNDQGLDRYRDSNLKENFQSEIVYKGDNLSDVPARNASEYARNLLKILFEPHELQSSLLPSQQSKRYLKPELDHERFKLLNEAVRTRYRISKYHYGAFYKDHIQETLAGCLYNEGIRKLRKKATEEQQQSRHDQDNTQHHSSGDQ